MQSLPPARPRPYRFSFTFRQGDRAGYEVHIHTIQLNIEKLIGGTVGMDSSEFGAYMSLIVACYQAKNNLPNDEVKLSRIARCSLKTWRRISPLILSKFTVTDSSISSESVQKEIEKYSSLSTKNRANRLKTKKTNPPLVEPKSDFGRTNTNNNNQITSNKYLKKEIYTPPIGVEVSVWEDFLKIRKAKKAPMTDTALKGIIRESDKAGLSLNAALEICIERNWQGFKAEWLEKKPSHNKKILNQALEMKNEQCPF